MNTSTHLQPVTLIAGPCSIDTHNISEVYQIAEMKIKNGKKTQRAIAGTRVVGLKSRTDLDERGEGMGIDFEVYMHNVSVLIKGGSSKDFRMFPSVEMAIKIHNDTGMSIATEIMNPLVQMSAYVGNIRKNALLPWNPAVNQLGWHVAVMADFARTHGWSVGLKNGKWVGDHLHSADSSNYAGQTTMEKAWIGLAKYTGSLQSRAVLIHRGVDVPGKGNYRSAPVHSIAMRVKKSTGCALYFDPSHSFGPKMRDHIPTAIVDAMTWKMPDGTYVYDGILIEAGTSSTDTHQHVTLQELQWIANQIATFRPLREPPYESKIHHNHEKN